MEHQRIATPVGELAVKVLGQGAPVVLWNSLFVDDRSWERVEPQIAEQRRLVVITGPGHGHSSDPGRRYSMEDCAEAALAVLDHLGVQGPVDWVGNAWGGHVGIVVAARRPDRCRSVVTLGSPVQPLSRHERVRTRFLLAAYRAFGPVGFIRDGVTSVLLSPTTRERDSRAVEVVQDCLMSFDRRALANAIVSVSLRRRSLEEYLPRVVAPTLFVTGADHQGWTPEQARHYCALLPDGSWTVVPDAAYLLPLEAPDETLRIVRDFWESRALRVS